MRIVLDLQGAQTESRFRGIGRYSLSLAHAIIRNRGQHEVVIALSGLFPDTIGPLRAEFAGLLPQENIRVWSVPGPVRESEKSNTWRRKVAELTRECFLASLRPDVLHISSLFEGYLDDAVTSIGKFDRKTPVSLSLYDLIPLLNPEQYLRQNPSYEQFYMSKINQLGQSSLLLTISEYSRQEAIEKLNQYAGSIVNVSTAADSSFYPITLSDSKAKAVLDEYGLTRPFVLYTGGADERKNLPRLIRAYAQLSADLRDSHQLVFAGKMSEDDISSLKQEAKKAGLLSEELIFTGYVTNDELLILYNLCELYVFPSWHEGFGLPALEAMSCGAAVIGSNTTSLPDVIGQSEALFDPYSEESISSKITQVLTDKSLRTDLARHGLAQAKRFSWDECARRALSAFEQLPVHPQQSTPVSALHRRLAFVSPLPPERTGIADYSAELLPELAKHYDIDLVLDQEQTTDIRVPDNCTIRSPAWLKDNVHRIERVLYQFGNSPYHWYMLELLKEVPGTVVLHDFFLSGLMSSLETHGNNPYAWTQALYHSHGYTALRERNHTSNIAETIVKYPVNLSVLQQAQGVIVHSDYSRKLTEQWYGGCFSSDLEVIPPLLKPQSKFDKSDARKALKLKEDDFIVCSYAFLDPTKLNHRLLDCWLNSGLSSDKQCILIFVGENHGGDYGKQLLQTIHDNNLKDNVRITGWVDGATFQNYLAAADIAVQLRARSRGESSRSVLDCMSHGLPTIINSNGAMESLPTDAVWAMPDLFSDAQLVAALETLWQDEDRRNSLGERAREVILTQHAPNLCAKQYVAAIEKFYAREQTGYRGLIKTIAHIDGYQPDDDECLALSQAISECLPLKWPERQLLLDITATAKTDLKTGIERVTRSLTMALGLHPPSGYRVEPVYLSKDGGFWHYRYARQYTLGLLDCTSDALHDEVAEIQSGDIILCLDISGQALIEASEAGFFSHFRNKGVSVHTIVYDLLPIVSPEFFPPGANIAHSAWLHAIASFDGAICISRTVSQDLENWLEKNIPETPQPCRVSYFLLGADVDNSAPTTGVPDDAEELLTIISRRPSFLMVGTVEPRKGHLHTLAAFNQLWQEGHDINLIIVGKEGWKDLPDHMRRTIPEIVTQIRQHPELGKRLLWLENVSDEFIKSIYASCSCLIAASEGEGFGLPLIEAAQHKLPILASDIPVFREVAGTCASYYIKHDSQDMAHKIKDWLAMYAIDQHPRSAGMPATSWRESAVSLLSSIIDEKT